MADTIINTGNVLPEFEKRKTWETTTPGDESTTETVTQAPERAAAGASLAQAGADELAAAGEQKTQADLASPVQRQGAQDVADIASRKATDSMAAVTSAADDIARARAYTQKRKAEYEAYGDATLFGHTDTKGEIVRGVALALGGLGDAIQRAAMVRVGRNPPTIDTVGEIIDGVLNQQREHIGRLKDSVLQARTGETDAIAARQQALADVDLRGAVMLGRAKSLMEARLAAMGKTPDQIAADANIAAISAKIADKQAAHTAPLLDRLTKKTQEATVKSGGDAVERAPSPSAAGKSPTGATAEQSSALAKYIDEHPNGSQGDYVAFAASLKIPDAQGEVTRVTALPEKERERQTLDYEGKPVLAASARTAGAVSDQVNNTKRYVEALDSAIDAIGSGGVLKAGESRIHGTQLNSKLEEVIALGAPAMGMTLSDSRQKLDTAISGAGGVGVLTGGAVENLKRLRQQAIEYGHGQVAGRTTPVRSSAPEPTRATAAPSSDTNVSKPTPDKASERAADIKTMRGFLVSPAARKDPAKRKQVYDTLKAMGEKF